MIRCSKDGSSLESGKFPEKSSHTIFRSLCGIRYSLRKYRTPQNGMDILPMMYSRDSSRSNNHTKETISVDCIVSKTLRKRCIHDFAISKAASSKRPHTPFPYLDMVYDGDIIPNYYFHEKEKKFPEATFSQEIKNISRD